MSEAEAAGAPTLAEKLDPLFRIVHPPGRGECSLQEVAEAIRARGGPTISATYLGQLRRGVSDNPPREHLEALADFFRVRHAYFFDDDSAAAIDIELDLLEALRDANVSFSVIYPCQRLTDCEDLSTEDRLSLAVQSASASSRPRSKQSAPTRARQTLWSVAGMVEGYPPVLNRTGSKTARHEHRHRASPIPRGHHPCTPHPRWTHLPLPHRGSLRLASRPASDQSEGRRPVGVAARGDARRRARWRGNVETGTCGEGCAGSQGFTDDCPGGEQRRMRQNDGSRPSHPVSKVVRWSPSNNSWRWQSRPRASSSLRP